MEKNFVIFGNETSGKVGNAVLHGAIEKGDKFAVIDGWTSEEGYKYLIVKRPNTNDEFVMPFATIAKRAYKTAEGGAKVVVNSGAVVADLKLGSDCCKGKTIIAKTEVRCFVDEYDSNNSKTGKIIPHTAFIWDYDNTPPDKAPEAPAKKRKK